MARLLWPGSISFGLVAGPDRPCDAQRSHRRAQAHGAECTANGVVAAAQRLGHRPRDNARIDIVERRRLADRAGHVDDGHLVRRAGEQDAVRLRGVDEEADATEVVDDLFEAHRNQRFRREPQMAV
jgi:hypothetical protein